MASRPATPGHGVTAVLGPTNTGKTHLAVERMLAHGSGMIGLPLRLLAREIYDRVRLRAGDAATALVTGEEKIVPARPRYWVATVEAMPPDVSVPFLAIDEIQLAADFERGHIFTDRLLNRRGTEETMMLGAATMRPMLERLLPGTSFVARPRFSRLTYAGQKKLTRLPRRSAVVAFSGDMVYAVAELIRRQRGGAAVVMGALSPRTRNAQVAMYQSGEVDYIVATDAIGMGLNMDVDHVAFASTRKFDGFQFRSLTPAELAQVAGRAGRYMNDGTFGVTGEADPLDQEVIDRLESHDFDPVRALQWRNRDLDFRSLDLLRKSLGVLPRQEGLTRAQSAPDVLALEQVVRDPDTARLVAGEKDVALAWEVCQIPDYRNISEAEHGHLVCRVIQFLHSGSGLIPEDWFARQLRSCENYDGDIDTLQARIAHVRSWTYLANRGTWLEAPLYWQARTREIEDRLSDALHDRLRQRFIDRRTSVLMRRLAQKEELMSSVESDGSVVVEGEALGRVEGLTFMPAPELAGDSGRLARQAVVQAVAQEIQARAGSLAASADTDLKLSRDGKIIWQQAAVGEVQLGDGLLALRAEVLADDTLTGPARDEVRARLQKFTDRHVTALLEPLQKLAEGEGLEGLARGMAFRLVEALGVLARDTVAEDVKALSQEDRAALRKYGVRFGAFHIFLPALLKPAPSDLRLLLWWLAARKQDAATALPQPPGQGLTSAHVDETAPEGFYRVSGFRVCGPRAVRVDMLERLADVIRDRVFWRPRMPEEQRPSGSVEGGGFTIVADMMSLVGCSGEEFEGILKSLGFRAQTKRVKKPAAKPDPVASEAMAETAPQADASGGDAAAVAAAPAPVMADAPVAETPPEAVLEPVDEPAAPAAENAAADAVAETPAAEPDFIEIQVWWPKDTGPFRQRTDRPGEGGGQKPHHQHRRRHHGHPDAPGAAAPGQTGEATAERAPRPDRPRGPDRPRFQRPPRSEGEDRPEGERKPHRHGKPRRDDRRDGDRAPRVMEAHPPRQDRKADPLSPFAVLEALKAQMSRDKN